MLKEEYIKQNWAKKSLEEMEAELNIDIGELIKLAYDLGLCKIETPNIGRTWTEKEDEFLKNYADQVDIRSASNLLYRSYYATYQRVRLLGLEKQMVNRRRRRI